MLLNCHYFSNALQTNVEINVIFPTPEGNEQITDKGEGINRTHYGKKSHRQRGQNMVTLPVIDSQKYW